MKHFHILSVLVAATLTLSSLIACAPAASRRVSLTLWLDTNDKEMHFFKQLARQFEQEHPRLRLKLRFVSFENLKPRFQGQVGETREPDILYMMNDWVGELVEQNLLRPLSQTPQGLMPQALQSMRYGGNLYGAPFVLQTIGLVYNRDLIAKPPTDSNSLQALQAKQRPKDHYTLLYDQRNFYYHAPWFHACGGQIFDARGHLAIRPEPLLRSLSWARSLQRKGVVPQGASYSVMVNLFSAGQSDLMVTGPWSISLLEENQLSYGVAPLPRGDCPGTPKPFIGVKGFGINRLSDHHEEAEQVIAFLTSRKIQQQVLSELDNLPVRADVYQTRLKPAQQVFFSQLNQSVPMPNHPLMKYVWQEMNWLLGQVFDGQPIQPRMDEALERLYRQARRHEAA
ncbi:MAG: hypothetical protein CVV27_16155 [Candidatus Melainabacteria bacterium HGW-Melainabacteria-1]|nr:MAG: hypothetical protein CVV27_16155 [Candidatus Melainabacteria bacterium HGW-Melainabacteria-1]